MSPEGWIFLVGFRVFDVGLLVLWLIWFFRLRDSDDDQPEDEGGGGGGAKGPDRPANPGGGGGVRFPIGRVPAGSDRARDGHRPPRTPAHRRHAPPVPSPLPARVRSPGSPA
ncbi:MAG: hypothetical protein H0U20_02450, partial [Thermoleophilaceae bacterium]|nr:hypothetical protein [Thermoleophilaceae bacterium]